MLLGVSPLSVPLCRRLCTTDSVSLPVLLCSLSVLLRACIILPACMKVSLLSPCMGGRFGWLPSDHRVSPPHPLYAIIRQIEQYMPQGNYSGV